MFKLVIQDDEGKTTVVPLIRDEITIGRKEGNTIRLTERNVSRRHARIVRANGAVAIEDLGSYNGVRVNGTRIAQRTSLSVSDRVQIGDYLIELKAEGVEQVSDDGKTQPIERMDPNFIESQIGTAATMPPAVPGAAGAPPGSPAVGLADTDPAARAISAMATAPIGSVAGHARMVVLSSNFAGQEWELARPQMIVGRTDDNDIVVNHRSISRNHAKIIREPDTGRYTISDLQSSNGVRVNGEEYGKVELRRGDIVDLGHVRLRFVEPGEDFLFGRDAQIADVPTGGKGKGLMIAAAVVLLGVGAIAVVMLTRGGGNGTTKPPAGPGTDHVVGPGTDGLGSGSGSGSGTGMVAVTTPDAAATIPGSDIAAKLAECRGLRDAEDWIHLLDCGKAMLTIDPKNPDAPGLIEQAKREQATQLTVTDLDNAIRTKDPQAINETFKKISPDSIYYEKAQKAFDKAKADSLKEEVAKAKTVASHHDCKTNDRRADQVARLWDDPAAGDAIRQVVCHDTGAGSGGPPPPQCKADSDCNGGKVCKSGTCVAGPPPPACDANVLLDEARAAGSANQWSKMLQKAEASNKCSPAKIARQLSLLAACHLGNKDKALKYWNEFQSNAGMRQACIAVIGP